eukprot:TRINITY_DN23872_c0_g1_i1.p1 TRINITY_DN23872_c0_g1~~TRINITY_DN23872_c0_g1_i1.p1  ORF type:complete len:1032 (+),score=278.75 TRINITY_DN23872_c0_g1_i1:80-3097(+)
MAPQQAGAGTSTPSQGVSPSETDRATPSPGFLRAGTFASVGQTSPTAESPSILRSGFTPGRGSFRGGAGVALPPEPPATAPAGAQHPRRSATGLGGLSATQGPSGRMSMLAVVDSVAPRRRSQKASFSFQPGEGLTAGAAQAGRKVSSPWFDSDLTQAQDAPKSAEQDEALRTVLQLPAPPLAQQQLQGLHNLVESKLSLAQCASIEDCARLLAEAGSAVGRFLRELPSLCANLIEAPESAVWSKLYDDYRRLPVLLPKARYEAYFGGKVFVNCVARTAEEHATRPQIALMCPHCQRAVAPSEWGTESPPQAGKAGGEFAQAITRKRLSAVIARRKSKRISQLIENKVGGDLGGTGSLARRYSRSLFGERQGSFSDMDSPSSSGGQGAHRSKQPDRPVKLTLNFPVQSGCQTEPTTEDKAALAREEALQERVRGLENRVRQLHEHIELQRIAYDTLKGKLVAKAKAVKHLRVNLWQEVCMLREKLTMATGQKVATEDYVQIVSVMEEAFAGLEVAMPKEVGKGPLVNRQLAAEWALERQKKEHEQERVQWHAERLNLERRFRMVLAQKAREIERIHNKSQLPALFGEIQALFHEVYQFQKNLRLEVKAIQRNFGTEIDEFASALGGLAQQISAQLAYEKTLKVRIRHMEELVKAFKTLVEPMLLPVYRLTGGRDHPWPFAQWQQPLHKHISQMYGADAPGIVQTELDAFHDIYQKLHRFVIDVGGTVGGGGPAMPVGRMLADLHRKIKGISGVSAEHLDVVADVLNEDREYARKIAQLNFILCGYSGKMRATLDEAKKAKTAVAAPDAAHTPRGEDAEQYQAAATAVTALIGSAKCFRLTLQNLDRAAGVVRTKKYVLQRERLENAARAEQVLHEARVAAGLASGPQGTTIFDDDVQASQLGSTPGHRRTSKRPSQGAGLTSPQTGAGKKRQSLAAGALLSSSGGQKPAGQRRRSSAGALPRPGSQGSKAPRTANASPGANAPSPASRPIQSGAPQPRSAEGDPP